MTPVRTSRVITTCAVGFLALDGILLVIAGVWSGSVGMMILGALFGAGALLVVVSWRRHQERIRELNAALAAREAEFLAMQRELQQKQNPAP